MFDVQPSRLDIRPLKGPWPLASWSTRLSPVWPGGSPGKETGMSSFFAHKLDTISAVGNTFGMGPGPRSSSNPQRVAALVRQRIQDGGERLWRLEDFRDLPFAAVAKALSRLTKAGKIERLSKGVYYRARKTAFGKSRANPAAIERFAARRKTVFPAGVAAANLLGFTTQTAGRRELATSASSLPRKLVGQDTVVRTRRPEAWSRLSETDTAMLDFLRRAGRTSELTRRETVRKTLELLTARGSYRRLLAVANTEPPRVRAMLGALGQQLGRPQRELKHLRDSLNPSSRFDFGMLAGLEHAWAWQAKERH